MMHFALLVSLTVSRFVRAEISASAAATMAGDNYVIPPLSFNRVQTTSPMAHAHKLGEAGVSQKPPLMPVNSILAVLTTTPSHAPPAASPQPIQPGAMPKWLSNEMVPMHAHTTSFFGGDSKAAADAKLDKNGKVVRNLSDSSSAGDAADKEKEKPQSVKHGKGTDAIEGAETFDFNKMIDEVVSEATLVGLLLSRALADAFVLAQMPAISHDPVAYGFGQVKGSHKREYSQTESEVLREFERCLIDCSNLCLLC